MSSGKISVTITAKSPLHVGGAAPSLLDQPTYRIDGRLAIPGSTLKGAARHIFEDALREKVVKRSGMSEKELAEKAKEILKRAFQELDQLLPGRNLTQVFERLAREEDSTTPYLPIVCDPLSHFHCNPPTSAMEFPEDAAESVRLVASIVLLRRVSRNKMYCPACTFYGGNGHPSPLIFNAARADHATTAVTTRVSIDRYTGAAKQQRLFTVEYVPPGTEFKGEVELHPTPSIYIDVQLIQEALNVAAASLREVKQIGKYKSVGYGYVEIHVDPKPQHTVDQYAEKFVEEWCKAVKECLHTKCDAAYSVAELLSQDLDAERVATILREYACEVYELVCAPKP